MDTLIGLFIFAFITLPIMFFMFQMGLTVVVMIISAIASLFSKK